MKPTEKGSLNAFVEEKIKQMPEGTQVYVQGLLDGILLNNKRTATGNDEKSIQRMPLPKEGQGKSH